MNGWPKNCLEDFFWYPQLSDPELPAHVLWATKHSPSPADSFWVNEEQQPWYFLLKGYASLLLFIIINNIKLVIKLLEHINVQGIFLPLPKASLIRTVPPEAQQYQN